MKELALTAAGPHPHTPGIDLDPLEALRNRRDRERRLHTVELPIHRAWGSLALALVVLLHNTVYLRAFDWGQWLALSAALAAYSLVSWLVLRRYFRPLSGSKLPNAFLVADIGTWLLAIYCSGGAQSLLFFLMMLRAADRSHTNFRTVLFFGHVSVLGYGALIAYLAMVEQQSVSWGAEAVKLASLYVANLYLAFTTRTASCLRQRTRSAVHVARDLIRQLEIEKRRAEAASRSKTQFLANLSHEFRTPMNGVIGMTELALLTETDEEQRERLLAVRDSAESLLRTLNDMLEFSHLESNAAPADLLPLSLSDCVGAAIERFEPRATAKGLALRLSEDAQIPDDLLGDPEKIEGTLAHLLDNAVKFTQEGEVVVRTRLLEQTSDGSAEGGSVVRVVIEVSDTGVGIAPPQRDAIFGAFIQADASSTRLHGGTGLGLAVTSRLVELMQGRIDVASSPGVGSTFTVQLPLRRRPPREALDRGSPPLAAA